MKSPFQRGTWQLTSKQSLAIIYNILIKSLKQLHKKICLSRSQVIAQFFYLGYIHLKHIAKIAIALLFQQLDRDLLRSQSANFGKSTICCSVKGSFGLLLWRRTVVRAVLTGRSTILWALMLLGLVLSSERLCIVGLHAASCCMWHFCHVLYFTFKWAEPWWDWPLTWLTITIVLQCYDTVGWVIRPVKSSPKWYVMCRVGR